VVGEPAGGVVTVGDELSAVTNGAFDVAVGLGPAATLAEVGVAGSRVGVGD